jgi:hypothetical protein
VYSRKLTNQTRSRLESSLGFELRDYTLKEVEEYAYRLRAIDFSENQAKTLQALEEELQRYIVNELHLCKIDFRYWANRYCHILSDRKQLVRMEQFWPAQERLLSVIEEEEEEQVGRGNCPICKIPHAKIRVALLKSRQIGGTVLSEALAAHMTFLQPNTQSIIGSDHPDNTLKLWQTLMRMYDNLPGWMRPRQDAKPKAQNLHFPDLDSDIVYGSGNQKTTLGQGMTVDCAHLSEVSTWLTPGYLDADLFPAFDSSHKHHSLLVLESTGAGAKGNWFHDKFMSGWERTGMFRSVFIAWYMRPTWREACMGVELDKDTQNLARRVKETHDIELDKEQLAFWQRRRLEAESDGKLDVFYQEMPSVMEESFQTGYRSVFPIELRASMRREARKPIDVYEFNFENRKLRRMDANAFWMSDDPLKWENKVVVWERKKPGYVYIVGVDASHGIDGGDNAAIEVLRVGNKYRPDEQVAEYCAPVDALSLAEPAWVLGHIYSEMPDSYPAKVVVEVNPGSPGIVTQNELLKRHYPNFFRWRRPLRADGRYSNEIGWWTTPGSRPMLTERGRKAITDKTVWINSEQLVSEMDTYVNTAIDPHEKIALGVRRRHLEAAPGYHDDRIMALFIALEVAHADDYADMAEERKKHWELQQAPKPDTVQFNTILDKPWDELVADWESQVLDGM